MSAKYAVLLTIQPGGAANSHLACLFEFLGIPCKILSLQENSPLGFSDGLTPSECGLMMSAETAAKLLHNPQVDRRQVRALVDTFNSLLIFATAPSVLAPADLLFLTRNNVDGYEKLGETGRFSVSAEHRELCGPLSGTDFARTAQGAQFGLRLSESAASADTLITVEGKAAFLRLCTRHSQIFLWTGSEIINLAQEVVANFDAARIFAGLVPYVIYARSTFGDLLWRPKRHQACLIIDDPPLHRRYGFLNLLGLLQTLERAKFAAALAFIPWNAQRFQAAVVNAIRRGERLELCIHGCDHTRSEFGGTNARRLDTLVLLGLQRMCSLQEKTGIPHDKIMVFPQGTFSLPAMSILKRRNFNAAVNTEVVPNHHTAERGRLPLRDLLDMSITAYHGFPLFSRRNCTDPLSNHALDLFLGKPCLLVAHHDYFQDGFTRLEDLVSALKGLDSELRWAGLGRLLQESYLWRRLPNGTIAVRMYANTSAFESSGSGETYEVSKVEKDPSCICSVLVDETPIPFIWDNGLVRFCFSLRPGQMSKVQVLYNAPESRTREPLTLLYSMRVGARRYLCEVRDNYVLPVKRSLRRLFRTGSTITLASIPARAVDRDKT